MLRPFTRIAFLLVAAALAGCATARTTDVLESRLRHQEDLLANYESQIARVKTELSQTRSEAEDLRLQLAGNGRPVVPAEESGAVFRAAGIQFSSLMTGGADVDGKPGHERLSVVLVPHDQHGELVKLPGTIEIEAFDLSQPGGAQRIGQWTFDQRDVHQYWHKGVIQSGYQFELPWQTPPQSDQVLVHGRMKTANGRQFDTTLTVKVDPPASALPTPGAVQQVSGDDPNPFAVQHAAAERRSAEPEHGDIIWAAGEGPSAGPTPSTPTARSSAASGTAASDDVRSMAPGFSGTSPFRREAASPPAPSQGRTLSGADFTGDLYSGRSLSVRAPATSLTGRSRPEIPSEITPQEAGIPAQSARDAAARQTPPPIADWWSTEDASTLSRDSEAVGTDTSDSWTDETMPRYR